MSRYRWEPTSGVSGRYRDTRTGRYVSPSVVRRELDAYIDTSDDAARALTKALRNREINLADWELAMRREIKRTHLNAIALERGGWANMRPSDYGRAGQVIREQYGYLGRFGQQIADGTQKLDGRAEVRARLYTQAGRETFYRSKQANLTGGLDMVCSIKHARDSCRDCEYLNGKWFRVGDPAYLLPGRRQCNKNCRCTEKYGRATADGRVEELQEGIYGAAYAKPVAREEEAFFIEDKKSIKAWKKPPGVIALERDLSARFPSISWDFTFLDEDTAGRVGNTLADLIDRYPQAQRTLGRVQSYDARLGSLAMVDSQGRTMYLSAHYFRNPELLARELLKAKEKGWLDAGNDIESVIAHEFGHVLHFGTRTRWQRSPSLIDIMDQWEESEEADDSLSYYATTSPQEAIAEGFAQMMRRPRSEWAEYTRRLQEFIDTWMALEAEHGL